MAIDKKLIHFKSKDNFMSANGVNGNIDSPTSGSEENGNAEYGQVKGTSIAFVKDSKEIWTHGNLYKSVNWSTLGEGDNTTDGYHAELQDKTVEITENGTVEVNADAGYYGLNRVSIKTNVPQSGGESGSESANIEYLDTSNADQDMIKGSLLGMGLYAHINLSASMNWTAHLPCAMVTQLATIENSFDKVLAIAIDFSAKVRQFGGDFITAKEYLIMSGVITQADIDAIPRITEEEFYAF